MEAMEAPTPPPGAGSSGGHWQDEHVRFESAGHLYFWRGNLILRPSVSSVYKKYFVMFDNRKKVEAEYGYWKQNKENKYRPLIAYCLQVLGKDDKFAQEAILSLWESDGKIAADAGSYMHDQFDNWWLGKAVDPIPELTIFEKWFHAFNKHAEWELYATEKILVKMHPKVDELVVWAGSSDLILKHRVKADTYALIDYKRIRQPQLGAEPFEQFSKGKDAKGTGPFTRVDNNKTGYYTIQLNMYAFTLYHDYGIDCRNNLYLLQFYGHTPVNQVKVPYLAAEMESLFAIEAADTLREFAKSPSDF